MTLDIAAVVYFQVPMKTIAGNAGAEGAVIVGKVEESNDPNWGYNAATGEWLAVVTAVAWGTPPGTMLRMRVMPGGSSTGMMPTVWYC